MLTVMWTPRRPKRKRSKVVTPRRPKVYTEKLSATETRVLKFYKSLKDRDGNFCRSVKTIAKELGVSPKTVRRANAHLKEIGLLSWKSGHGNGFGKPCQANRYWVIPKTLTRSIREASEDVTTLVS
jgi:hypothetical protein